MFLVNIKPIGHFRVPPGLCFKNEGRCSAFDMEIIFITVQIKLIFTKKVVHLASFWKWEFLELRSGLLVLFACSDWLAPRWLSCAIHFRAKQNGCPLWPCATISSTWCCWEDTFWPAFLLQQNNTTVLKRIGERELTRYNNAMNSVINCDTIVFFRISLFSIIT